MGPQSGLGHQRRMEALAEALRRVGARPTLIPLDGPVEAEVLIVDSYLHRADDPTICAGGTIVAVDDLERDLAVDLVVDPTPGAAASRRAGPRALAGAEFALVGPGLPNSSAALRSTASRVLVTLGGTDAGGLGPRIAADLAGRFASIDVRLAVGPWATGDAPPGVTAVRTTAGLGEEIAAADIVVTAGGVTLIETLALGRPAVVVVIAENQRKAVAAVCQAGAAVVAASGSVGEVVATLVEDHHLRRDLAAAGSRLIDRRGPDRVAAAVRPFLCAGSHGP